VIRKIRLNDAQAASIVMCSLALAGCAGSSRTVHLKSGDLTTETPIQLDRNSFPIAASPDGSRIAFLDDTNRRSNSLRVLDTDTLRVVGSLTTGENAAGSGNGTTMFSLDGKTLFFPESDAYVAWDYSKSTTVQISKLGPTASEFGLMGGTGWNGDRSLAILFPDRSPGHRITPGQVAAAGNVVHTIPPADRAGFDEFGNAWFGSGRRWTKVDRHGVGTEETSSPGYLTPDQSKDRGSMHLRDTHAEMKYKDGTAAITCVWLTDDRAVPYPPQKPGDRAVYIGQDSFRAAVVFAGPDILDYGFLPGRNLVYVVSQFGSYLVPFSVGSDRSHRPD